MIPAEYTKHNHRVHGLLLIALFVFAGKPVADLSALGIAAALGAFRIIRAKFATGR